jgi:hypothetical protein
MGKKKPDRIWSNRNFSVEGSVEWIEKNEHGFMWKGTDMTWKDVDSLTIMHHEGVLDPDMMGVEVGFGFPVPLWFVKEKFAETGREYKEQV